MRKGQILLRGILLAFLCGPIYHPAPADEPLPGSFGAGNDAFFPFPSPIDPLEAARDYFGDAEGFALRPGVHHSVFRSGDGTPRVAVTPTPESGAVTFEVNTPVGVLPILVQPVGPGVNLTPLPVPETRTFRPPSIFSAPLPTGSGARALGFSGAFTAIADDATAASWNPAGLIQLKRPEVSSVYRYSWFRNEHSSDSETFEVTHNEYDSHGLNYLTLSLPFKAPWIGNNLVFSMNVQEAYDFSNRFTAKIRETSPTQSISQRSNRTFSETQTDRFVFEAEALPTFVEVVSEVTTRSSSTLRQEFVTDLEARLDFEQEGVIDAISPAAAFEISPRLAVGGALNLYQDDPYPGKRIRSVSRSEYTATTTGRSKVTSAQATSGSYTSRGITVWPEGGTTFELEPTSGTFPETVQSSSSSRTDVTIVDGSVTEVNEYDHLEGINATFGLHWVVNNLVTLGAAVDLPWDAEAEQTRTTTRTSTTYNQDRSRVLGDTSTTERESRDVEWQFPLFAAVGAFFLWTPNLYTSIDVSYGDWSSFAYKVEGEGRINPFDGTPHGQNRVQDTWSVRTGTEYLLEFEGLHFEVPLRAGLIYEQRPAIGRPDEYWGFSLGTGFGLGQGDGKLIFDLAYQFLRATDVQTVVPDESSLSSDTEQHQVFGSLMKHF